MKFPLQSHNHHIELVTKVDARKRERYFITKENQYSISDLSSYISIATISIGIVYTRFVFQ
jgi:hypothetical protein